TGPDPARPPVIGPRLSVEDRRAERRDRSGVLCAGIDVCVAGVTAVVGHVRVAGRVRIAIGIDRAVAPWLAVAGGAPRERASEREGVEELAEGAESSIAVTHRGLAVSLRSTSGGPRSWVRDHVPASPCMRDPN